MHDTSTHRLRGDDVKSLVDTLVAAFPRAEDLAELVAVGLEINLAEIADVRTLRQAAFDLIQWTEAHGRTAELVRHAQASNPSNARLAAIADRLAAASPPGGPPPGASKLPELPPNFHGRDGELETLARNFATHPVDVPHQVLTGLGGVGKTRLALEYATRHAADYDVRRWLRAGEIGSLHDDLIALGEALGVLTDPRDIKGSLAEVQAWLAGHRRWLLILDNVEDPEILAGLLPSPCPGHVLITARESAWRGAATPIPVGRLDRHDAIKVLLGRSRCPDDGHTGDLVDFLAGLPLAVVQAAAYIDATQRPFAAYLALLEREGSALFRDPLSRTRDYYPDTVASVWQLNFTAVRQADRAAADLLEFLALIDPDGVPLDLLTEHRDRLPSRLAALFKSPRRLDAAIALLRRFSLVDREGEQLRVHRMVQSVTRDALGRPRRRKLAAAVFHWARSVFAYTPLETPISRVPLGITEQLLAITSLQACTDIADLPLVDTLKDLSMYYLLQGDPPRARQAAQRASEIAEAGATAAPHDPRLQIMSCYALERLAQVEFNEANYPLARAILLRAMEIVRAPCIPRRDHAIILTKLGTVETRLRNFAEARAYLRTALEIHEDLAGKVTCCKTHYYGDLPHSLETLGDLAMLEDDLPTARDFYQRCYTIKEELTQEMPRSPHAQRDRSVLLGKLGEVARKERDPAAAHDFTQRALDIRVKLAQEDPRNALARDDLTEPLRMLGELALRQGDETAARGYYQRALTVGEDLARTSPRSTTSQRDVSLSLEKLGDLANAAGRFAEARAFHERCFAIKECLARDYPGNAHVLRDLRVISSKLGRIQEREGDLSAAREAYQRALDRIEAVARDNPTSASVHRNLVAALIKLGALELREGRPATDIADRILAISTNFTFKPSLAHDMALALYKFAVAACAKSDFAWARTMAERSTVLLEGLLSGPLQAEARQNLDLSLEVLAACALAKGDLNAAVGSLERSVRLLEDAAKEHPGDAPMQVRFGLRLAKLGLLKLQADDLPVARTLLGRTEAITRELESAHPSVYGTSTLELMSHVLAAGIAATDDDKPGARRHVEVARNRLDLLGRDASFKCSPQRAQLDQMLMAMEAALNTPEDPPTSTVRSS